MTRKQIIFALLSFFFLLIAYVYDKKNIDDDGLEKYAISLEDHLKQTEKKITILLEDTPFLVHLLKEFSTNQTSDDELKKMLGLTNQKFTLVGLKDKEISFWSNNLCPFEHFDFNNQSDEPLFKRLGNANYIIEKRSTAAPTLEAYEFWSFIPVKYDYALNSTHLKNKYSCEQFIPQEVALSSTAGSTPIKYKENESIAWLTEGAMPLRSNNIRWLLTFYFLGFLFFAMLVNSYAKFITKKYNLAIGSAFLISIVLFLTIASALTNFTERFSELSLFNKDFVNLNLSGSLGDFLINLILMLWIILFFHRNIDKYRFSHISKPIKHLLAFLNASVISLSMVNIANVNRGLILDSNIELDFDNILNINNEGLLAILGVVLLSLGLFLFSHLLMLIIMRMDLPKMNRQVIYGAATLVAIPMLSVFSLEIDVIRFLLFIISYMVLFDIFVYNKLNNLAWLVIWVVIMAIFSSSMIYNFNKTKDIALRKEYAKTLSVNDDFIAEKNIKILDKNLSTYIKSNKDYSIDEVEEELKYLFTSNTYLFNNYTYTSQILDTLFEVENKLYKSNNNKGGLDYSLAFPYEENKQSYFLTILKQDREQSKVYNELMKSQPYKGLRNIDAYDYAIYKNYNLVFKSSKIYEENITADELKVGENSYAELNENMRSEIIYHSSNGDAVFISKKVDGWIKPISLFSYLFALLIVLILFMGFLNLLTSFLPKSLSFDVIRKPSLKNRIQLSVISIIILSFIIIGLVTVIFFRNSHVQYHEQRLQRKTNSVIRDINHELDLNVKHDSLNQGQEKLVADLDLKAISKIHRLDINLFNKKGELVKSSETDFFDNKIISSQMSPSAYMALHHMGRENFVQENEMLGNLSYKTAYLPMRYQGESLAYLGLPYYSENSRTQSDASTFMGTLLNVYVFLLLIAGMIAIAMANSITKPLSVIGQKLNNFRLGGRNEALEWKSKDEIGTLISEYNKMVAKIGESAEILAKSEREGAWREMAKQVAHEIKNPLTPMKLSIQYLMHAVKNGAENVDELMERVSNTLIQQIDNLANIATEFSNFAKMPSAENEKLVINTLVETVFNLFTEIREVDLVMDKPANDLWVYADKNHLVSVFNNIIKNAIQAIPEGKEGKVNVHLYESEGKAIVKISDNGKGISDEEKEKVFVPNFTTKSSGTGLGLAISKKIIESVDGNIRFETEYGIGTDFYVSLPIVEKKIPVLIGK